MLHKRPVASILVYTLIIFVKSAFLSINLISTFCTQLGLIDVLSANELAEIFACVLLD